MIRTGDKVVIRSSRDTGKVSSVYYEDGVRYHTVNGDSYTKEELTGHEDCGVGKVTNIKIKGKNVKIVER